MFPEAVDGKNKCDSHENIAANIAKNERPATRRQRSPTQRPHFNGQDRWPRVHGECQRSVTFIFSLTCARAGRLPRTIEVRSMSRRVGQVHQTCMYTAPVPVKLLIGSRIYSFHRRLRFYVEAWAARTNSHPLIIWSSPPCRSHAADDYR